MEFEVGAIFFGIIWLLLKNCTAMCVLFEVPGGGDGGPACVGMRSTPLTPGLRPWWSHWVFRGQLGRVANCATKAQCCIGFIWQSERAHKNAISQCNISESRIYTCQNTIDLAEGHNTHRIKHNLSKTVQEYFCCPYWKPKYCFFLFPKGLPVLTGRM